MDKQTTRPAERRWADFVEARKLAETSQRLEDGIRAGRAWAAFLQTFVEPGPSALAGPPQ